MSPNEEAAVTFLAELKELIRVWYYLRFLASNGGLGMYPTQIREHYCTKLEGLAQLNRNVSWFEGNVLLFSHRLLV